MELSGGMTDDGQGERPEGLGVTFTVGMENMVASPRPGLCVPPGLVSVSLLQNSTGSPVWLPDMLGLILTLLSSCGTCTVSVLYFSHL